MGGRITLRSRAARIFRYHGYKFRQSSDLERLKYLMMRAKRGLISYDNRTVTELRRFCKQRKLNAPKKISKIDLVTLLETADDNVSIKGFQDLPAELRVRIYDLLFAKVYEWDGLWWNWDKGPPSQPAVTRTSRLLRQEALPVFQDTVRAPISFRNFWAPHEPQVSRFFDHAPSATLAQYKKILVDGTTFMIDGLNSEPLQWEIDLATKGKEAKVRCTLPPSSRRHPDCARILKAAAEQDMHLILQDMGQRGETR